MITTGEEAAETRPEYTPTTWAYLALILNPICLSSQQLAMRSMKKLNDSVVSTYMAFSLLVVFLPICLIFNFDLTIAYQFSFTDWLCIIGISVITIVAQTLRFMAISNHPLAGLQPFTFIMPLQQFLTDVLLFQLNFSALQFLGMQLLILVYVAPSLWACLKKVTSKA